MTQKRVIKLLDDPFAFWNEAALEVMLHKALNKANEICFG
ncbi:hypothetical protein IFVP22_C170134 [Vibrio parahaemolyticus]